MTDSASWTERYAAAAMVWDTTPNQFVVEACSKLRPGRALDLGAGEGRNALWLAGRGWKVTAVDFALIAVSRISSRAAVQGLTVDAVTADALTYQPNPASLDLVLLSYLQLPAAQLRKVLAHAAAGLAPGGRLVLVAHDAENIGGGYGGPQNPDVLTTAEAVATMAAAAGLDVMRAEVVEREVQTDHGARIALDHVVEAVRPATLSRGRGE
jgi:SAM-dependent methyltransferase